MKQRSLFALSGTAAGSCLIPNSIAQRIHNVCIGANQPLALAPDRYSLELYALSPHNLGTT
jgi:hypothetical protein